MQSFGLFKNSLDSCLDVRFVLELTQIQLQLINIELIYGCNGHKIPVKSIQNRLYPTLLQGFCQPVGEISGFQESISCDFYFNADGYGYYEDGPHPGGRIGSR